MLAYWHVTNRCPHNCHNCYMQANRTRYEEIPHLLIDRMIHDHAISSVVLTGGEPLICEELDCWIESLCAAGKGCRLYTSGWHLDPERAVGLVEKGVSRIRISCDSLNHTVMGRYSSFDIVHSIGREIVRMGAEFEIGTTIIPGENDVLCDIEEIARICDNEGFLFSCSPMFPCKNGEDLKPIPDQAFKLLWKMKYSGHYSDSGSQATACDEACPALNSLLAILPDGRISPCDNLAGTIASKKSISDYGVMDIIASEEMFDQLKNFIPRQSPPCNSCSLLEICCGGCRAIAHFGGDVLGCDPWGKQRAEYYLAIRNHIDGGKV